MSKFYQQFKDILSSPILGIIFLSFLYSTKGSAQPFPVSVNTQLTTPSLPYLADYVSNKPETLRAILLLNDDSRLNYEVILKVRISGQGIELASRADYFSVPINLMYNVPEILTGFELADLFDPNNLDISGMSKSEFLKTGQLPEGIYTICFEAYDINRFDQLPVSNGGCAVASVIEHEPPYLIQPKEFTQYTEPTILPFNWHPGHTISFLTEYRLYLYEDIPGWTEDQIILYQAPLYTTETPTTTYLYSANDPLLERGASYFWRVQAYDPTGFELFKNNGFSQLAKFTYGQHCDTPLGLVSLTANSTTQLIRWVDSSPGIYELRYRSEEIILNSNPVDSINTNNNIPSEPNPINSKGKGKKNASPLGGNTQEIASAPIANTNINQFSYSDHWTTISDISEQEYILNILTPHRYEIQVRRICGFGDASPWSASVEIDNRQPESPEFLLPPEATDPTEITETLFTANWNYQVEAYFELQVARDPDFAILLPGYENLTVTDLSKSVVGVNSGQTYYYRVKAKRGDLESAWSNVQIIQTTSNSQTNIASILALPAQPLNYDGFTANWSGTNMVTIYHLEVARDREFTQFLPGYEAGVQEINSSISDLPISIDLIAQGVFYRIRTAGISGLGYSNIIEVPRQYLPVPIALEPTDINSTGFTANWEALTEATEYIIDVSTNPNFSELIPELSNQVISGNSISFTQYLDPENTTYFYQVRAKIDGRTSANSNPIVVSDGSLSVIPIIEPATQIKKTSFWANWQNLPGINTYALDVATTSDFSEGSFIEGYENKIVYGESHKVAPVNFASTQYFYRVRAVVDDIYSIYSNDQEVRWRGCYFGPMAMDYSCGIPADPYFNEGLPMIAQLEEGDTIQAGDYLVILKEVNNSSPFSGTGYVAMPFQQLRLNLEFTNIKVDETCRMVDGRMEGTGVGLALISEELASKINDIVNILETVDDVLEAVEEILEEVSDLLNASKSVGGYFTNGLSIVGGTDQVFDEYPYLPPNAVEGLQAAIDCFKNTLSPDCKDDLIAGLQNLQDHLTDHFNSSQQIIFQASPDQVFGFDSIVHPAFSEHYQGIMVAGKPYQIPWKSVQNGVTDTVEARMADGSPFPENIRFEDADKNIIPTVIENGIAKLTITGVGDQEAYPIYAVETGDTIKLAGKLNIVSYDPKPINLVVVPVNGAEYPFSQEALSTKLQDVFQGAVINLSISVADNFQTENFDGELDGIATDFAKSYTDEMKTIFQNYESSNPIEEDTYYIFLLPRFATTDQLGYMPRKKQFGFVNNEQLQQEEDRYIKTLAHELAHGAFALHHTFEQHSQLAEKPTENLLDYSRKGTITHQYQWAAMHNPSRAWTLFDKDEERGQVTISATEFLEEYIVEEHLSFLTSHAEIISVKADQVSDLIFATGGEFYGNSKKLAPIGTLVGFTITVTENSTTTSTDYSVTSSGNCIIRGSGISSSSTNYSYKYSGLKKPIVVRPVKRDGENAINIIQLVDYVSLTPRLKDYDFLVNVFYNSNGESIGEIKPTNEHVKLGTEFNNELYLEFVSTYPNYAEYDRLSSFYVHGMAVPISQHTDYYQECEYLRIEKLRSAIDLFERAYENQSQNPIDNLSIIQPLVQGLVNGANPVEEELTNKEHTDKLKETLDSYFTYGFSQSPLFNEDSFFNGIDIIVNRANTVADYNVKINRLKNAENSGEEFNELRILLKNSFTRLHPCELKLLDIDKEDIKAILKYMVFDHFFYFDFGNGESFVSTLLSLLEENEYEDFLSFLSNTTITEEERITISTGLGRSSETTIIKSKHLWEQLMLMCDDGAIFGNAGRIIIEQLIQIFQEVNKENNTPFTEIIADITAIQDSEGDGLDQQACETVVKKIIPYNYTRPLHRVGTYFINSFRYPGYGIAVPEFILTEIEVNEDGTFNITQNLEFPVDSDLILSMGNYENLTPFEPVVVDMQSKFGLANSMVNPTDHKIYPAIIFYYFDQVATTTATTDLTFAAIDGISLAFPPAYITKVRWLNNAFAIVDKASAILSLAGSYNVDENPDLARTLNLTSAALGFTSLAGTITSAISRISKKAVNNAESVEFLANQINVFSDGIVNGVKASPGDVNLIPINLSQVPIQLRTEIAISFQKKIDDVIDAGRSDLIDFVRAEQTITKLIGNLSDRLKDTFKEIVPVTIYDDLAKVNGVVKLFDKQVETSILALGQGNPNIQKELFKDIINSATIIGKIGKELGKFTKNTVTTWEDFFEVGSLSRRDFASLEFLPKLDDYPNLKTKFLNDLDDAQRGKFVEDFKDAEEEIFVFFEGNVNRVDAWNSVKELPTLRVQPDFLDDLLRLRNYDEVNFDLLMSDLPAGKVEEVINATKELVDVQEVSLSQKFIERLGKTDNRTPNANWIKDNISNFDSEIIKIWGVVTDRGRNVKALDFDFLSPFKGKNNDEIIDGLNSRDGNAIKNSLEAENADNTRALDFISKRGNIKKNFLEMIENNSDLGDYFEAAFSGRYGAKGNRSWSKYFDDLEEAGFNAIQIHHLLPCSLMSLSDGFRQYLRHVPEELLIKFNVKGDIDILNAIPLEQFKVNNGGVHSNHLDYTKALQKWLDQKWNSLYNANGNNSALTAEAMHDLLVGGNGQSGLLPALKSALTEKSITGSERVNNLFKNIEGIPNDSWQAVDYIISQY